MPKGKTRSKTKRKSKTKPRLWIKEAKFEKGAMRSYVRIRYGSAGFNKDGTLKISVLEEIANDPTVHDKTRKRANAALTLKKFARKKREL